MKTAKNEHLTLEIDYSTHLLRQTWTGIPSSVSFQTGSLTTLKLVRKHHIKRWLIDLRQLRMFNPTDLRWFMLHWLPKSAIGSTQDIQLAIVLNDVNQFGKLGTDMILRASAGINQSLSSRYFLDMDDARQWLFF